MKRYRILCETEETRGERVLGEMAVEVVSLKLGIREPRLRFMVRDERGEIGFEREVAGLCRRDGIFVLKGLPPAMLVRTTVHEVRHAYQREKMKWLSVGSAEKDALLFETELLDGVRGRDEFSLTLDLAAIGARVMVEQGREEDAEHYLRLLRSRPEVVEEIEGLKQIARIKARYRQELEAERANHRLNYLPGVELR
ncbi:MAG TPA: hypothetical protein VNM15_04910 [Candidatus Binatia bacterium]|nr:hypothetical protein [Candidatus Binatia bacterium]